MNERWICPLCGEEWGWCKCTVLEDYAPEIERLQNLRNHLNKMLSMCKAENKMLKELISEYKDGILD